MGYTHYWTREKNIGHSEYDTIRREFTKLLADLRDRGVRLAGLDGLGAPEVSAEAIAFNGDAKCGHKIDDSCRGDCSHEGFWFPRISAENSQFCFCKTARKRYDLAVQCFLIVASRVLKDKITVKSDGASEDWAQAQWICERVLGYGKSFKLGGRSQ